MIDWNRVRELRDEIGADEFDEVVELFLEEVDDVISRLRKFPDPNFFEEDLHFLKGSAWNLGFKDFGELCQQGETLAAAGKPDAVEITPILECYQTSRDVFVKDMDQGLAAA